MKELKSQIQQIKLRNKFLKSGVKMLGPETIYFSKDTKIGKNVIIEPYVVFGSKVKIGNNVTIKSFSHLENCKIENKVDIGPYARIRPGVILKEGSKVGNFVEIKKSIIGKKSKVNHLTYIGDSNMENQLMLVLVQLHAIMMALKKVRRKFMIMYSLDQIHL